MKREIENISDLIAQLVALTNVNKDCTGKGVQFEPCPSEDLTSNQLLSLEVCPQLSNILIT